MASEKSGCGGEEREGGNRNLKVEKSDGRYVETLMRYGSDRDLFETEVFDRGQGERCLLDEGGSSKRR